MVVYIVHTPFDSIHFHDPEKAIYAWGSLLMHFKAAWLEGIIEENFRRSK